MEAQTNCPSQMTASLSILTMRPNPSPGCGPGIANHCKRGQFCPEIGWRLPVSGRSDPLLRSFQLVVLFVLLFFFRSGTIRVKQLRSPACPTLRTLAFSMGEGPPAPLGRFRDRPPAGTCRHVHADRRARLRRTILPPVHPLRSIRRSQGRGVGHQIALHTCQLLGPTVPYPDTSAIRSRRPAVSVFASESHLRSPGGISGPAGHPARPTLASSRGSPVPMHRLARGQPSPSICSRNPERQVAARLQTPF